MSLKWYQKSHIELYDMTRVQTKSRGQIGRPRPGILIQIKQKSLISINCGALSDNLKRTSLHSHMTFQSMWNPELFVVMTMNSPPSDVSAWMWPFGRDVPLVGSRRACTDRGEAPRISSYVSYVKGPWTHNGCVRLASRSDMIHPRPHLLICFAWCARPSPGQCCPLEAKQINPFKVPV
jgi:hypothetical protein